MAEKNTTADERGKDGAARVLDDSLDEIFEIYEAKLIDEQNLLVTGDAETRELLREQAFSLVRRAARTLRGDDEDEMSALEVEIHHSVEAARTPLIQHPDESFRAGAELCAAALEVILARVDFSGESPEAVVELSLAVQKSVMDHVARVSMASYVDYLLMKIGEIQTEERHRFSRDLHDHIAHSMALVKQNIELYSAMRGKDEAAAEAKLQNALKTSEQAISMARDMSMELRRSDTGDTLRVALDNLMKASVPPGIKVEVEVSGDESRLPSQVRDQVYMMMREGLRNAVSHSSGERIRMEVEVSEKEIIALVEDWGDGFEASDGKEGVGMRSMRERAKLLRGSFDIASAPGKGTRVETRVPLNHRRG